LSKKYKTYHINCAKCQTYILTYHKYGSGKGIIRLYVHRIMEPLTLVKQLMNETTISKLSCPNCNEVLGVYDIQKSKPVFRMRKSYFHRHLI